MLNFCLVNIFNYPKLQIPSNLFGSRELVGSVSVVGVSHLGTHSWNGRDSPFLLTSAQGAMGGGERRALRLFSLPIGPLRTFFSPSPQPPYDTRRHLWRREGQSAFSQLKPF